MDGSMALVAESLGEGYVVGSSSCGPRSSRTARYYGAGGAVQDREARQRRRRSDNTGTSVERVCHSAS